MRKILLGLLLVAGAPLAYAQSTGVNGGGNLSVQGAVTPSHCAQFVNSATISDAGASCGGSFTGVTTTGTPATNQVAIFSGTQTITGATTLPTTAGGTGAASLSAANIPVQSGAITTGDCVKWLNSTTIADFGAACATVPVFQSNGVNLTSATTINFQNSAATNGLTLSFANPSAGNIQLGLSGTLLASGGGTGATSLAGANIPVWSGAITSGDCVKWLNSTTVADAGAACGTGGGGATFQANGTNLTSQTTINFLNSAATDGLTFTFTNPSAGNVQLGFSGTLTQAGGGTGATSLAGANIPVQSGAITSGHCVQWATGTSITDSGAACGSGGSSAFSALTTSTNTTATMTVGSGASITTSGTGVNNANQVNGAAVATSAVVAGTNSSGQIIVPSINNQTVIGNGSGAAGAGVALTLGGNLVATSTTLSTSQAINAQTGTTYTVASGDAGKLLTLSNAASIAVTLPQAGTTGFTSGFSFDIQNLGAGTVTITPTSSTVNGSSTLVVKQNESCTLTSDGTNYQVSACNAVTPAVNLAGTGHGGVTGTLAASSLPAALSSSTSINGTTVAASAGTAPGSTGAFTLGHCLEVGSTSPLEIQDNGSACGTGGSTAFSAVTGGTNSSAAMVVGTGASLATSGSGTIAATSAPLSGVSGMGTGVGTALAINVGTSGAVVTNGGAGGTPSSINLTNGTSLPVSGISGLATGMGAFLQANTTFTIAATGCTPSAHAGGAFGGTITLATGPCTSIVVTMNGATGYTAAHGYDCSVGDQTTQNAGTWIPRWNQTASTTTTATIPIPAAAGATDVITFTCSPN